MTRRIIHLDMDAFYAAVEQADNPELRGLPVIIGGTHRGVVSAASYEARKFGVHSAMPMYQARRLCPQGVVLPVRMSRYKEVSRQVMEILSQISPLVEQVSIDEAYLDITGTRALHGPSVELARRIKQQVYTQTSLTCSIGLAPNKFLAKIASDLHKPDGLTVIEEGEVADFLRSLPVGKIPGVGAKTVKTLESYGVYVVGQVLDFPLAFWVQKLGKSGAGLYEKAQGIDLSEVESEGEAKSIGAENTLPEDTDDLEELKKWLLAQCERVGRELRTKGYKGKTITLKIKFADFKQITRSYTLLPATQSTELIYSIILKLLSELKIQSQVRLTGVAVANFAPAMVQRSLFPNPLLIRQERLDNALDNIQKKFGYKAIRRGRLQDFES
jgi:DNA polymerase-4